MHLFTKNDRRTARIEGSIDLLGVLKKRDDIRKKEQEEKERKENAERERAEAEKAAKDDSGRHHHHKSSRHHHKSSHSGGAKTVAACQSDPLRAPINKALAKFAAASSKSVASAVAGSKQTKISKHSGISTIIII